MAAVVLDASVLAALYVEEPLTRHARAALGRLQERRAELHAPDLLLLEVANALWKRVRRCELDATEAIQAIGDLADLAGMEMHPARDLARPALGLALAHGLTAYDAAYLALAAELGTVVLSGDESLCRRGAALGLPVASVREWDGDKPA